ncbi:hypothetical protein E2562_034035 [Oryza meyeriana var. granulata]|uniref:Uncharacterized protein n=1 Tax=Oryza meyeriana var. granulata TaxID=110450 RepID=A0A6G1E6N9_9ORYZ|nr:hypothetical protein E2562_034035 [Oryza meyeriana var. granulata]
MATTGEERYESEVLWPDHQSPHDVPPPARATGTAATPARRGQITCHATASSRPVDIPRAAASRWSGADQADDGGSGTMVPPHVMVSRRRSEGEAAFSLRSGTGRARRDLSHLRNSVLRMTGFIEG